jgi:hypothetical protein
MTCQVKDPGSGDLCIKANPPAARQYLWVPRQLAITNPRPVCLDKLQHGDIVQHADGNAYTVIRGATPGHPAIAIKQIQVSNPGEWVCLFPGAFHGQG